MKSMYKIKLDINDVNDFLKIANTITNDINLAQGSSVVSGKSLMGIFSLNLSEPINLIIRDLSEEEESIINKFENWIIE